MSTPFQPDNPHPRTSGPPRWTTIALLSVLGAVMVVMLLGIVAPRLFQQSVTNWAVTLGLGAVTLVVGLGLGYWRRVPSAPSDSEAGTS